MSFSKKSFLAAVLAAAVVFVAAAAADHGDRGHGRTVLRQGLVGSILTDPPIHGVARGGLPWVGTGQARLQRNGRFEARIRGLVIPSLGTPGPVTTITISLYCAPESSSAVFTTQPVALSSAGNARVRQHVTLPSRCLAPVLLVHPNGGAAAYIAATGFATS